jgi:ribosomal protein L11 methylase PrmA
MSDDIAAQRGPFAGTEGHLDAPYWQTPAELVEAMLDLAGLQPGERLVDLGCGDGRIVLAAAKRGAEALGIDIDRQRIAEAEAAARAAGLSAKARFRREDMFETPLGEADVVTLYLLGHVNNWLRPRLLAETRPGTRIVSHVFPMREWEPAATQWIGSRALHLWIVPEEPSPV